MGKLSRFYMKTLRQEKEGDFTPEFLEELNRVILMESSSCEDAEFVMRALELSRCPYCLAYYDEKGIIRHSSGGQH